MPALSDFTIRLASSSQIQQYLREAFDVWGGGKSWEVHVECRGKLAYLALTELEVQRDLRALYGERRLDKRWWSLRLGVSQEK